MQRTEGGSAKRKAKRVSQADVNKAAARALKNPLAPKPVRKARPVSRSQAKQAERGFYKAAAQLDKQVTMRSDAPKTPKAAKSLRDSRDVSAQRRAQKKQPDGMRQYMGPKAPYRLGDDLKPGLLSSDNRLAAARKIVDAENAAVRAFKSVPGAKAAGGFVASGGKKALAGADAVGGFAVPAVIGAGQATPLGDAAGKASKAAGGPDFDKIKKNAWPSTRELIVTTPTSVGMTVNEALFGDPKKAAKDLVEPVKTIAKHPVRQLENDPAGTLAVAGGLRVPFLAAGKVARGAGLQTLEGGVRKLPGSAYAEPVNRSRGVVRNAAQATRAKATHKRKAKKAARPADQQLRPITEWIDKAAERLDPNRPLSLPKGMRGIRRDKPVHNGKRWVEDKVQPKAAWVPSRNKVVRATDELQAQIGNRHQRVLGDTEKQVRADMPLPKRGVSKAKRNARVEAKGKQLTEMRDRHEQNSKDGIGVDRVITAKRMGVTSKPVVDYGRVESAVAKRKAAEADARAARATEQAARQALELVSATVRGKPIKVREAYPGRTNLALETVKREALTANKKHGSAKQKRADAAARVRVLKNDGLSPTLIEEAQRTLETAKVTEQKAATTARLKAAAWRAEKARMQGVHPTQVNHLLDAMTELSQAGKAAIGARTARTAAEDAVRAVRQERRAKGVVDTGEPQVFAHAPDAAMAAARAPWDAVVQKVPGDKKAGIPDQFVVVPRIVSGRLAAHKTVATSPQPGAVMLRSLRSGMTKAVLPVSPNWALGQLVEPPVRAAMRGTRPVKHGRLMRKVEAELKASDPEAYQAMRDNVYSGGQIAALKGMDSKKKWAKYSDKLTDQDASAMSLVAHTASNAGDSKLGAPLRGYGKFADTVFSGNVKGIEHPWQVAMSGQALTKLPAAERMLRPGSKKNVKKLAEELKKPENQQRISRYMDDSYGRYGRWSPVMRSYMSHWAPFAPWPIAASKLLFNTMPAKQPGRTAIAGALEQAHYDERVKAGLSSREGTGSEPKNKASLGAVQAGGRNNRTSKITPFGLLSGDPLDSAAKIVGPTTSSLYRAVNGLDLSNNKIRDPETNKPLNAEQKAKLLAWTLFTQQAPGAPVFDRLTGFGDKKVRYKKPRPGWDNRERLMQFMDPTRPYPPDVEAAMKAWKKQVSGGDDAALKKWIKEMEGN